MQSEEPSTDIVLLLQVIKYSQLRDQIISIWTVWKADREVERKEEGRGKRDDIAISIHLKEKVGGGEHRSHSLHVVELVRYTSLLGLKCHSSLNVGLYLQYRPKA